MDFAAATRVVGEADIQVAVMRTMVMAAVVMRPSAIAAAPMRRAADMLAAGDIPVAATLAATVMRVLTTRALAA
jgi:hypothetical protein